METRFSSILRRGFGAYNIYRSVLWDLEECSAQESFLVNSGHFLWNAAFAAVSSPVVEALYVSVLHT